MFDSWMLRTRLLRMPAAHSPAYLCANQQKWSFINQRGNNLPSQAVLWGGGGGMYIVMWNIRPSNLRPPFFCPPTVQNLRRPLVITRSPVILVLLDMGMCKPFARSGQCGKGHIYLHPYRNHLNVVFYQLYFAHLQVNLEEYRLSLA